MAKNKEDLRFVPLSQVRPNEVALRSVDKDKEAYIGLVDSIKAKGVLNPVVGREVTDPSTGVKFFALIDGLHRYTGAVDAGLETIPMHIVTADEAGVLEMQIIGNIHKVETKPVQYSEQLQRLLVLNPLMTGAELATKLGKSITWISERLGLLKLIPDIKDLVDSSQINITNAYQLAKLPPEEQGNFVDRAMTMPPNHFVPTVTARVKEIRDAKRQGRQAEGATEFIPPLHLQKLSTINEERKSAQIGQGLINQYGLATPLDAWKMALDWALHADPLSIQVAKQKEEARKEEARKAKEAKKAERDAKAQQEAIAVGAGVGLDNDDEE